MSRTLTVELSEAALAALGREAAASGCRPEELVSGVVEREYVGTAGSDANEAGAGTAPTVGRRGRFRDHFGAVDLGYATGVDNASIDADLERAYAAHHRQA